MDEDQVFGEGSQDDGPALKHTGDEVQHLFALAKRLYVRAITSSNQVIASVRGITLYSPDDLWKQSIISPRIKQ